MFGIFLIIIGGVFLARNVGIIDEGAWDVIWPIALVAFGLYLIAKRHQHGSWCDWCGCDWKKEK